MRLKKILILAMSCNQEIFIKQERLLREKLYAKDILENKVSSNVDFWTYTASTDGKYHVNKKLHRFEVPTGDGLNDTFEKTQAVFKLINQLGIEYDYIFRTNCSTYVNIEQLKTFINNIPDETYVYSGNLYLTPNATGPFEWSFYGCGNALILSKFWVNVIDNANLYEYRQYNQVNNPEEPYYKIDDNTIGLVINTYACINNLDIHIDMYNIWHDFAMPMMNVIPDNCYDYIAIPFREYNTEHTRDNEEKWALEIHNKISGLNMFQVTEHTPVVHIIDFNRNMRSLVPRTFAEQFLNVMSYPRYMSQYINLKNNEE